MVTKKTKNTLNKVLTIFECDECHLKFKDRSRAEECEAYCKKYHACKLDIINYAEKE